jgi:hypothetical protein
MKDLRTRLIVTLASSAVLASGLSVALVTASSGTTAAVAASGAASSGSPSPNVTIIDP